MRNKAQLTLIGLTVILIVSGIALAGCSSEECAPCPSAEPAAQTHASQPVILIAAFGTSVPEGQKDLEAFDSMVLERCPGYDVRWGLTAGFIVNKLRKAGQTTMFERKVPIKTVDEIYSDLRAEGKTNVAVQCTLMMVGAEFREVLSFPTDGLNVKYGWPLLFAPENMQNAVTALADEFGQADTATILCAHGNAAYPEFNAQLVETDTYLRANYENTYLACVEGPPGTDCFADVLASGVTSVRFIPFMLVAGDHMENDVMGDDPESWKSQLGLPATSARGLGSNAAVMEIFLDSIEDVLGQF